MSAPVAHLERLDAAIHAVCLRLERCVRARNRGPLAVSPTPDPPPGLGNPVAGSALDAVGLWFGLSPFETGVLVLAAGVEISPDAANLCALAQGDPAMPFATPALALAVLFDLDGAGRTAFGPAAPLRDWQLVSLSSAGPAGRLQARIDVPDAVLQLLAGEPALDARLAALIDPVAGDPLLPADVALAARLAPTLADDAETVLHLTEPPTQRALAVAAAVARGIGTDLYRLPIALLPAEAERGGLLRLWQRDRLALRATLAVTFEEPPSDERLAALARIVAESSGPMLILGAGAPELSGRCRRPVVRVPLPEPDPREVAEHWCGLLGRDPASVPSVLADLADRFRLPLPALRGCLDFARREVGTDDPEVLLPRLLALLRDQVREGLTGLADPLTVRLGLDDLVLPEAAKAVLLQIAARQRHRGRVLDDWGLRHAGGGSQGMSVLFSGPSGTGKTMAAEALARNLGLDLFRVDLSRIVDKYIGETEKRLARLFDAADAADAILLFDEADALFGRRSDVRDSHDRYANLEVGYLLQRIERFRGIAVLTTNLPDAIDPAFARRFAFALHFEFPAFVERREIWRRAFPEPAPTEGLDWDRLAKLSLSGGQIRVVAVNAGMLAASDGTAIGMGQIARALTAEYAKQRRAVPASDLAGWPA